MNLDRKSIEVRMWDELVGKIAIDAQGVGYFKYSDDYADKNIEPSPIWMPVKKGMIYSFPKLNKDTFKGLPGLIADSLPDAFGDKLLDIHFEHEGITNKANIELLKLCYISSKATGALEYAPALVTGKSKSNQELSVGSLLDTVEKLISSKQTLKEGDLNNIQDIVSVGSSLGGAAPKAVIDIDFDTMSIRPGNVESPSNFEPWIIKFDAVKKGAELEYSQSTGFGNVEYAYHIMAKNAGIEMNPCRLYEDQGRSHFMTKRFDRVHGEKIHMQTLHAIAHMDSYAPHDYKTYFRVLAKLKLPYSDHEEMYRRAVFNGISANTDTHTKNTAFLMSKDGTWSLSPCYDLICSVSMRNNIEHHKTMLNAKPNNFTRSDYLKLAEDAGIKTSNAKAIISEVSESISEWQKIASENGVRTEHIEHVDKLVAKNLKLIAA